MLAKMNNNMVPYERLCFDYESLFMLIADLTSIRLTSVAEQFRKTKPAKTPSL